jgi:hypothetical protein
VRLPRLLRLPCVLRVAGLELPAEGVEKLQLTTSATAVGTRPHAVGIGPRATSTPPHAVGTLVHAVGIPAHGAATQRGLGEAAMAMLL